MKKVLNDEKGVRIPDKLLFKYDYIACLLCTIDLIEQHKYLITIASAFCLSAKQIYATPQTAANDDLNVSKPPGPIAFYPCGQKAGVPPLLFQPLPIAVRL